MDNQQGPIVEHMELYSNLLPAWMGRELGGEWIHVYVWLSSFAVHLKLSTLLIGYQFSSVAQLSSVGLFATP